MLSKKWLLLLILVSLLLITGCIPGDGSSTQNEPAGFFSGIWHGWIAPLSLILEFFKPEIRIYEKVNSGVWYDLGFYIAAIGGFGGIAFVREKTKKK
ncbi:hypothetical protein ACFL7D_07975 [candidate division KSB1 bacterium]